MSKHLGNDKEVLCVCVDALRLSEHFQSYRDDLKHIWEPQPQNGNEPRPTVTIKSHVNQRSVRTKKSVMHDVLIQRQAPEGTENPLSAYPRFAGYLRIATKIAHRCSNSKGNSKQEHVLCFHLKIPRYKIRGPRAGAIFGPRVLF